MGIPIHKRKFYAFISHAYINQRVVDAMEAWLTNKAGLPIWYDAHFHQTGTKIASELGNIVEQCRSMIILLSKQSVASGWVREEFDASQIQRTKHKDVFRVIAVKVEECDVPVFFENTKVVDLSKSGFDLNAASELLLSFYSVDPALELGSNLDVYISRSWHEQLESEILLANAVCQMAKQLGFSLIGGMPDKDGFNESDQIQGVISGCGGLIAILPDSFGEKTLKYILREMEIADTLGLPYIIVTGNAAEIPGTFSQTAVEVVRLHEGDIQDTVNLTKSLHPAISALKRQWRTPPKHQYIFYGTDLKEEHKERNQLVRRLIQRVSAMPCLMGEDIRQGHIQQEIAKRIVGASMMIADVSEENLNTCIEAGMAIGANIPLHLLAGGPRHKPPFMFRDQQIWHYDNDVELLGIVHNLVLPYRRHIINYELQNDFL